MTLLMGNLPQTVTVCGRDYPIHTDFRSWIRFEQAAGDSTLSKTDQAIELLRLCYSEVLPAEFQAALEAAVSFYAGGIPQKTGAGGVKKRERIYDYEYDEPAIYAAFWAQYGIDLSTANLHWYQFKALFQSLNDTNQIVKVMQYRSMDLNQIKDKHQRGFYRKMKKLYALPRAKNEQEKLDAIEKALLNGGDLSKIL